MIEQPENVLVKLTEAVDRSYHITIGSGVFSQIGEAICETVSTGHIVVITDTVVGELYLPKLLEQLHGKVQRIDTLTVPTGEETKSIDPCLRLWEQLLSFSTDRQSTIIALGGGVIGDLAGFVAACFARGLNLIQIPTTLLAQVDSSVGGKVGINLPHAKNMVGAFWQPQVVFVDPQMLETLDARNYRAGLAEVVKYGMIMDRPLFEFLEQHQPQINQRDAATLTRIIAWCCRCKAAIVEQDERELTGRRAILNYGHTLGHAMEAVFGYGTYLHGEAVSIGMTFAGRLACELGLFAPHEFQRQSALLTALGLPIDVPKTHSAELLAAMRRDKKVAGGTLNLILPVGLGEVKLVPAPADEILAGQLI